jgi:MFS family permease
MLIVGALLMTGAGLAFAFPSNFLFLVFAGTIGVVSPSGNEVGPFLSLEQATLAHVVPDGTRTSIFAWYTLAGSFATAIGALCGGIIPAVVKGRMDALRGYRIVVILYATVGLLLGSHARVLRAGGDSFNDQNATPAYGDICFRGCRLRADR